MNDIATSRRDAGGTHIIELFEPDDDQDGAISDR